MATVKIIGHRGAMGCEAENSLNSFSKAIELGCEMVELDVRTTRDGQIVTVHDEEVNRTSNGSGKVSELTLEDMNAFRLKNGEQIPTLLEALELMKGKCQVIIHIKDENAVLASCKIVKDMKMTEDVVFTAFHGPWLMDIKMKYPKARVACIAREKDVDIVRVAGSLGAEAINPASRIMTQKLIDNAHSEGLKVNVWTVNHSWQMKRFINWGVDGIITNRPDILLEVIRKMGIGK